MEGSGPKNDSGITRAVNAARGGNSVECDRLALVYEQLRQMAATRLSRERQGQTIQDTDLVHEAWMRLGSVTFENRAHFFGAAAEVMRRILVDRARRKNRAKHGNGLAPLQLDGIEIPAPMPGEELLAVHEALDQLAAVDPRKAELVKLRYFAGLPFEECAQLLNISVPTAKRDWSYARAWLHQAIRARPS